VADAQVTVEGGEYRCDYCFLPTGTPVGWEAALFDHYQAVVAAVVNKLRRGRNTSRPADVDGGSTYSFDVWPGHPFEERVTGLLRRTRQDVSALRAEVTAFNQQAARPADGGARVVFYMGQTVVREDEEGEA
jgi:hypothetical protein